MTVLASPAGDNDALVTANQSQDNPYGCGPQSVADEVDGSCCIGVAMRQSAVIHRSQENSRPMRFQLPALIPRPAGHCIVIAGRLGKNIFQGHGITAEGTIAFNESLRRPRILQLFETLEPCLNSLETCASSYRRAWRFQKRGHEVRLLPVKCAKACVKRAKPDAIDAGAMSLCMASVAMVPKTASIIREVLTHRTSCILGVIGAAGSQQGEKHMRNLQHLPEDGRVSRPLLLEPDVWSGKVETDAI